MPHEDDGFPWHLFAIFLCVMASCAGLAYHFAIQKSEGATEGLVAVGNVGLTSEDHALLAKLRNRAYLSSIETTSSSGAFGCSGISVTYDEKELNAACAHAANGGFSRGREYLF